MKKEQLSNIIVKNFEYIYGKVMNFNDYVFIPSENQKKQIDNFLDFLNKKIDLSSIGEEWVFKFMVFSFKQRTEQKTRYKDKIPFNWIVGKKSFELFEKRGENWMYFNAFFVTDNNLNPEKLEEILELSVADYMEEMRSKYYREEKPLHLCLNTVIFSSKSKYCLRCKDKTDCKLINE